MLSIPENEDRDVKVKKKSQTAGIFLAGSNT
jgi:hypothetical protein